MANEAIMVESWGRPIQFTVTNATGIEKGAVLKMTDARTAIITSGNSDMLAGIAAAEKVASDGSVTLGVWRNGCIMDMVASGAVSVGQAVASAGTVAADVNKVYKAPATASGAAILGYALETAADLEVFQVLINVCGGGNPNA